MNWGNYNVDPAKAEFYRKMRQGDGMRGMTPAFTILDEAFQEPEPVLDRGTVIQGLLGVLAEMDEIRELRAA